MATEEITKWIQERYPNPKLDPDWVNACVEFLQRQLQLDPVLNLDELRKQTLKQMLQSDLADSMLRDTGFPAGIKSIKNDLVGTRATGGPLLVQIAAITEIGSSAFTLSNVRQSRLDKADMTGLTKDKEPDDDENADAKQTGRDMDEEDATMPPYPRSMISLILDDGTFRIKAFEFKKMPNLVLGETPLGCKIMLRGVRVRNGIAMLEPGTAEVLGHLNDDMQELADINFLKSLRKRMKKPENDPEDGLLMRQQQQAQVQAPPREAMAPPPAAQRPPPVRRNPGPAQPPAPYFGSPSPHKSKEVKPAEQSKEFDDSFSMDEMGLEMDEEFLKEMEAAEQRVLNASQPVTKESSQPSRSVHGRNVPKPSQPAPKRGNIDIIDLSDSEEEETAKPAIRPPKRSGRAQVDTIELSD